MVLHCILISNVLPLLSLLDMRTSSRQESPNLRRQKSPNINLAMGFMKNVKQWKGLRWWEVEHSPQEGPCKLSQRPRHSEKAPSRFSSGKPSAYGLRFAFNKSFGSLGVVRVHMEPSLLECSTSHHLRSFHCLYQISECVA